MRNKMTKPCALLIAAGLVLASAGTIGTAQALPSIVGTNHDVEAKTQAVDVEVTDIKGLDQVKLFDKEYEVTSNVEYTGIDAYVRATVTKYWADEDGKQVDLDPSLIEIGVDSAWSGPQEETAERAVYYYTAGPVSSGASLPFLKTVKLSGEMADKVNETKADGVTTYEFAYDQLNLVIEVKADAIQTHNATEAIQNVWGVNPGEVGIPVTE